MSTVKVHWRASKQAIRDEFVATGHKPKGSRSFELELSELPEQDRAVIIGWLDDHCMVNVSKHTVIKPEWASCERESSVTFDAQPTTHQIVAHIRMEQVTAKKIAMIKAEKKQREQEEERKEAEVVSQIDQAAETGIDAVKAVELVPSTRKVMQHYRKVIDHLTAMQQETDKAAWIAEKGSLHLRRAHERGYNCQRAYVVERASTEAPSFTVDFNNSAEWKDRCCPSEIALAIEDEAAELELGTPVTVWLTAEPSSSIESPEYWDYEGFQPCEAVVIRRYLGKYDLVNIV